MQKTFYVFPDLTKATSRKPPAVSIPSKVKAKTTRPYHVPRNRFQIFGLIPRLRQRRAP